MYTPESKTKSVSLADLYFYFDAVEKSANDAEGFSRKAAQIATVRLNLLKLPHTEFQAVMSSIEKLIPEGNPGKAGTKNPSRHESARQLYEKTSDGGGQESGDGAS